MTVREIRVSELVGRRVRDPDGRSVGRVEELICEIELRPDGRDYVVRELHLGAAGFLEAIAGGTLVRSLLRTLGGGSGPTRYRVPWEAMDLTDPERPRVRIRREELPLM
ncbi:MAG: PRC-barrel domain-containing protein [Gemmatimonadales bacterium]